MKKARMKRKQRRKLIWMVAGLVVLLYLGLVRLFPQSLFPENDIKWKKSGRVYRAESDG